jgi:hypothetical protein
MSIYREMVCLQPRWHVDPAQMSESVRSAYLLEQQRKTTMSKLMIASFDAVRETVAGTTYTYTNGYGQMTTAGVSVQKGASAKAHVEIRMRIVTAEQSVKWFNENKNHFSAEQQSQIREHFEHENSASAWNAIFAWGAKGSSREDYFKDARGKTERTETEAQTQLVDSASKLEEQEVTVVGDVSIHGVSMLPTQAFVFAQISTIHFANGTSMHVLNQSNPVAATADGNTDSVKADDGQKLNVIPMK